MLLSASITDTLVTFATNVVSDLGLPGVFVLMFLESACIPIPSEATMLFAGFNVHKGEYSLLAITIVGSLANLFGSGLAPLRGYRGRVHPYEKRGHPPFVKPKHIQWADRWCAALRQSSVFFTRRPPNVRTFISLPAGVA